MPRVKRPERSDASAPDLPVSQARFIMHHSAGVICLYFVAIVWVGVLFLVSIPGGGYLASG